MTGLVPFSFSMRSSSLETEADPRVYSPLVRNIGSEVPRVGSVQVRVPLHKHASSYFHVYPAVFQLYFCPACRFAFRTEGALHFPSEFVHQTYLGKQARSFCFFPYPQSDSSYHAVHSAWWMCIFLFPLNIKYSIICVSPKNSIRFLST
jgi:hypothetical protein